MMICRMVNDYIRFQIQDFYPLVLNRMERLPGVVRGIRYIFASGMPVGIDASGDCLICFRVEVFILIAGSHKSGSMRSSDVKTEMARVRTIEGMAVYAHTFDQRVFHQRSFFMRR